MDAKELKALEAMNAAQGKQMKEMMKQMGLEMDDEDMDGFKEEDEYDKVLRQMGIDPNKVENDEDIIAMLGNGEDELDDDAALREVERELKRNQASLLTQA